MKKRFTDTTEFFSIDYGDIIEVGGQHYIVKGHERERRFGLEDPKFWVKRVEDAQSGERKIVKLSYFESFFADLGGVKIRCFRNPEKESDILRLVKDHPDFMQGVSFPDEKGNIIRVLDIVRGPNFFVHVGSLAMDHKTYFFETFPGLLARLIKAFESIRFLHANGFRHGDIRNDHIIIERGTGNYVWIDFDYDFETTENPFSLDLFGVGNIILYAMGKGFHSLYAMDADRDTYGDLIDHVVPGDFSILDKWRFLNLKKLYPYIPKQFNDVLMHFSRQAEVYYEVMDEIIEDLNRCLYSGF